MREGTRRWIGGALVCALGLLLTSLTVGDMYQDVRLGEPVWTTVAENSIPLLLDLGLIGVGAAIVTGYRRFESPTTVAAAVIAGSLTVLLLVGWVFAFQRFQSSSRPMVLVTHMTTLGAVIGGVFGTYYGRQQSQRGQLEAERDRISSLFENSTDCIAEVEFVDRQPVVRAVNSAFEETFGIRESAVVGEPLDRYVVPPDRREGSREIVDRAINGERFETEVVRETIRGERTFHLRAIPLNDSEIASDGYAVYTDVTEQKRYRERTELLHDATRALMEAETSTEVAERGVTAAADILSLEIVGIFQHADDELVPIGTTDEAEEMFGGIANLPIDGSIAGEAFRNGEAEYVDDVGDDPRSYSNDTPASSELIVPLGDHGVLIAGSRAPDDFAESERSLVRILAANVESALERADREAALREREAELSRQNDRLETFARVVSHDLRNPLSIARGYLDMALEGEEKAIDRVRDAHSRMDDLIEDLLTLARSGVAIDDRQPTSFEAVARDAWKSADADGLELTIEDDWELDADPDRLRQLLENLFRNSAEHADGDETIYVGMLADGPGFYVEDTGPGIPEAERDDVFEFGYSTRDGGTGIGLAIVGEIVDGHDWDVSIEDGRAGGARFEFTVE
ncbi:ATP-binding protein [Haloparvum sp. PAK95]|uniref:ATP-binding protein n=1 Tax=Haloparvum sp. PAK95 TaxID=3418962 RepID=UPI003D2F4746